MAIYTRLACVQCTSKSSHSSSRHAHPLLIISQPGQTAIHTRLESGPPLTRLAHTGQCDTQSRPETVHCSPASCTDLFHLSQPTLKLLHRYNIYMYIYTCIHACIYMYYICMHTCTCIHVCIYIVYIHVHVHYIYMYMTPA